MQTPAEERAQKLLMEHLSPEQRAEFAKNHTFHVQGKSGNVYEMGISRTPVLCNAEGRWVRSYCIHFYMTSAEFWPWADHLLAWKLLLDADEDRFLRTAG